MKKLLIIVCTIFINTYAMDHLKKTTKKETRKIEAVASNNRPEDVKWVLTYLDASQEEQERMITERNREQEKKQKD